MYAPRDLLPQLRAFAGAIGVHVLMAALVVLGTINWQPFRERQPVGLTIEAVIVDTSEIRQQREEARRAQEMEERRRQRAEELERQRQRELEQQQQEERRQQQLEEQRRQEAQDRLQQLRLQRERKLEEERLRQERELEQIRQQREAAERQRRQEEERLKQIEALRQREQQEELRRQQEAEAQAQQFRAGQVATLRDNYQAAIQAVVTQNWLRPPTAQPGLRCTLKIVQIPGGEVISAAIAGKCNGDEATRRSILAAVERGGALPYRGFEDVFEREIDFIFIYDGD
jgi:colicin import membrane protein